MSKVKDTFFGGAESDAGDAIKDAGEASAQVTRDLFKQTKKQLKPFIKGGVPAFEQQQAFSGALGPEAQADAFANFQEDPGTQFLRDQGLRLIESGAGATGGLGGGDRLRELTKFSQGLALQNLGSRFNQLGAVTGTGLAAASALGGVSSNAASGISQALQSAGAGEAAGITGSAAGLRSGIADLAGGFALGGFSDERLKTNKRKIGEYNGYTLWSWDWNLLARMLFGLAGSAVGLMSLEVMKINPSAVITRDDGYRMVKYGEV